MILRLAFRYSFSSIGRHRARSLRLAFTAAVSIASVIVVISIMEFLQEGSKVKASVFFKGRSIIYSEQGEKLLLRFAVELEEYGRAEQMPKLEGKRMMMMIATGIISASKSFI